MAKTTELFTFDERSMRTIKRAVNKYLREADDLAQQKQKQFRPPVPRPRQREVYFQNLSGETVPPLAVMRVTGAGFHLGQRLITIGKPNTSFDCTYLVNGPHADVANGFYGWAHRIGDATRVLYNSGSGTPSVNEEWGPADDQWTLEKYRYGFTILGSNVGGESTLALYQRVQMYKGKTNASHAKSATGTVSIYDGNKVDTGDDMTLVDNVYADIGSGKFVTVAKLGGRWFIIAAEC